VRFQCFDIKLYSRAASQTASVRRFAVRKRAAQIGVTAAEKFCDQSYLFSKDESVYFFSRLFISADELLKFVDKKYIRHICDLRLFFVLKDALYERSGFSQFND
jgi:hypothetical protein